MDEKGTKTERKMDERRVQHFIKYLTEMRQDADSIVVTDAESLYNRAFADGINTALNNAHKIFTAMVNGG